MVFQVNVRIVRQNFQQPRGVTPNSSVARAAPVAANIAFRDLEDQKKNAIFREL